MSNDDQLQDIIFVKRLHNTCVGIWQETQRILKNNKPGTWQYELAEKILPDVEALCRNFVRK
jgi:hypothetical protein